MLKLLICLPWCKPRALPRRVARDAGFMDPPAADDERPLGCGWFDSSHELQRGLQVQESDAQGLSLLPLSDWLDLELRGWCGCPQ